MPFHDLTDVEQAAMEAWGNGSADSTQCLIAVRTAVRLMEERHEQSEDAELAILRGKAIALAEEYEREPRMVTTGAVADLLREWVGEYR